jgi:alpha-tubulin suppressor-like RCC1 family protein
MRSSALALFASVAGVACYASPSEPPCSITCTDTCPDGLTCRGGYCAAGSDTCSSMPPAPIGFTAVAAGADFACALDVDHVRWCWGNNAHHVVDPSDAAMFVYPTRGSGGEPAWASLSAGRDHACGLAGGDLWCWGGNEDGQVTGKISGDVSAPVQIAAMGVTTWTAVSAGVDDTCAIGNGHLFCWGRNDKGQLGIGGLAAVGAPVEVMGGLTDWTAVSAGVSHTCAISAGSGVLCWGEDDSSDLGSAVPGSTDVPVVALAGSASLVAVSYQSSCAVRGDGELWCWGANANGELGELNAPASTPLSATPLPATTTMGWTKLTGGGAMLCGLAGSDVYCWGGAQSGGLADGEWADSGIWQQVATGASDVSTGCALRELGTNTEVGLDLDLGCALVGSAVECWGDNRSGQLAQGGATMATTPVVVTGGHAFTSLATGANHACALDGSGGTWCWGSTQYGATTGMASGNVGDDGLTRAPCVYGADCDLGAPREIGFAAGASRVATGLHHTCALVGDDITCWGGNGEGQLGNVSPPGPQQRTLPEVDGAWASLYDAGDVSQCAVANGVTYCWGGDVFQTDGPMRADQFDGAREITVNGAFGCELDTNGNLACYGDDTEGQDGDGSFTAGQCGDGMCANGETTANCAIDCDGPLRQIGRPYAAIALTGNKAGCGVIGIDSGGYAQCWGHNETGRTGDPMSLGQITFNATRVGSLANCTSIAMGSLHSCALCAGVVSCWGDDTLGELGDGMIRAAPMPVPQQALGSNADPWVELHAGDTYTCARSMHGVVSCWGFDPHGALGTGATGANLPQPIQLAP